MIGKSFFSRVECTQWRFTEIGLNAGVDRLPSWFTHYCKYTISVRCCSPNITQTTMAPRLEWKDLLHLLGSMLPFYKSPSFINAPIISLFQTAKRLPAFGCKVFQVKELLHGRTLRKVKKFYAKGNFFSNGQAVDWLNQSLTGGEHLTWLSWLFMLCPLSWPQP